MPTAAAMRASGTSSTGSPSRACIERCGRRGEQFGEAGVGVGRAGGERVGHAPFCGAAGVADKRHVRRPAARFPHCRPATHIRFARSRSQPDNPPRPFLTQINHAVGGRPKYRGRDPWSAGEEHGTMMRSARRGGPGRACLLRGLGRAASTKPVTLHSARHPALRRFGFPALRPIRQLLLNLALRIEAEGSAGDVLESWVMQGEMNDSWRLPSPFLLPAADIGRDGPVRERVALRVRTAARRRAGAQVLADRWPSSGGANASAGSAVRCQHLVFPESAARVAPIGGTTWSPCPVRAYLAGRPPPESGAMPVLPPEITEVS